MNYKIKPFADLQGANLRGVDLRGANLRFANLRCADLQGANLRCADLKDANLLGADLRYADLRYADLRGANLQGADLRGVDLGTQWIIQGPMRSDGYYFFLQKLDEEKEPMVKAGCHYFTIEKAMKHWNETRTGKLLAETMAIIEGMINLAKAQGKIKDEQA